jgi:YihY family inner membrane protein
MMVAPWHFCRAREWEGDGISPLDSLVARADALQQRHRAVAFPLAVWKRYGEDHGAWLGALISYYGLFAMIPFLLAFVTLMHILFAKTPTLLQEILDAVWTRLPFVSQDLRGRIEPVHGDPLVVAIAVVVAFWGAFGVLRVMQDAQNQMWGVPTYRRPGFVPALGRAFALIGMATFGLVATTIASAVVVGRGPAVVISIATVALNLLVNLVLVIAAYRLLTARPLGIRDIAPGGAFASIGVTGLTILGGLYVDRVIARTSALYGSFATIIGLFAWVSLVVQVVVIGNLINVVRVEHLWPRSVTGSRLCEGDRRAVDFSEGRALLVARSRLDSIGSPPAAVATAPPDERAASPAQGDDPRRPLP